MRFKLLLISILISVAAMAEKDKHQTECFRGRAPLPEFLYDDTALTLGVSDPAMDSVQAHKMAVTRALFVYALKQKANLKMMSDYYTKSFALTKSSDSRREKCLALASINIPPSTYYYNVADFYFSDRGEAYTLIDVSEYGENRMTISASCDFMVSYNYDAHERTEYKILMTVTTQEDSVTNTMDYSVKGSMKNPIIASRYGGYDNMYYHQAYYYRNEGQVEKDACRYPLENAFWCAFVESLCNNMVTSAINDVTVENLSETYNGTIQDMSREIINCSVSCTPVIKGIRKNKLSAEWRITKLK